MSVPALDRMLGIALLIGALLVGSNHPAGYFTLVAGFGYCFGRAREVGKARATDADLLARARLRVPGQQFVPPPRPAAAPAPSRPSR